MLEQSEFARPSPFILQTKELRFGEDICLTQVNWR